MNAKSLILTCLLCAPVAILAGCDSPDSTVDQANTAVDSATEVVKEAADTVEKTVENAADAVEKTE